jgi:hypothetical protein
MERKMMSEPTGSISGLFVGRGASGSFNRA